MNIYETDNCFIWPRKSDADLSAEVTKVDQGYCRIALEEAVFEESIKENRLKIERAIEGLRNLNLKIERVRDDIMMASTTANFFSLDQSRDFFLERN